MTQEDKDLLLRDLCGRLPYGVKMIHIADDEHSPNTLIGIAKDMITLEGSGGYECVDVEHYKPYLFPLSSMTEEQKNQLKEIWDADMNKALDYAISGEEGLSDLFQLSAAKKVINWFIKNHFDFQGLIPKELAIDCTNLNVY